MKQKKLSEIEDVQRWFARSVTYEGESYVIDAEQAAAVVCGSLNTIVVARAGSGKTRTIVAKIVYLVARCGVQPEEIMAFVFNANAAVEINARLAKMRVNGELVVGNSNEGDVAGEDASVGAKAKKSEVKIATTFHAFARKIVYEACGGRDKCGQILADEKDKFVLTMVKKMLREAEWRERILDFVKGEVKDEVELAGERGKVVVSKNSLDEKELTRFAKMMTQFIDRAQQKYLGGDKKVGEVARTYLKRGKVDERERKFVELGVECFRRYHWHLLDAGLWGFKGYGTDFNLIVSWASKLIENKRKGACALLGDKKYILIDEYQDFSQLFLAVVMAIREVVPEAKLFVVGDDWQAINRFAGSEVEYFKEFEKYFAEDARRLTIAMNYRCNYMVVDTARKFMKKAMGEKGDFRAFNGRAGRVMLVNPRRTECECAKVQWDRRTSGRDSIYMMMARRMLGRVPKRETVQYIKTLVQVVRKNKKAKEILLLHRNNETGLEGISLTRLAAGLKWGLERLKVMTGDEFDAKVRVMTMHKSKGLEAEVVIILEADEGIIPKTHPDTRLYGMFGETEEVARRDQVRLFYVAMTRAKKRLYIIHDPATGAGFVRYLGKVEKWEG